MSRDSREMNDINKTFSFLLEWRRESWQKCEGEKFETFAKLKSLEICFEFVRWLRNVCIDFPGRLPIEVIVPWFLDFLGIFIQRLKNE